MGHAPWDLRSQLRRTADPQESSILTIQVVQGHDSVQVRAQDLANLVHQGGVVGWVHSHVVPGLIPGTEQEESTWNPCTTS